MEEILTYPYTNPRIVKIKRAEIRYTDFFNFLGSLLVGLGEPYILQNLVDFTRIGNFTWRVSDWEELVGDTHRR